MKKIPIKKLNPIIFEVKESNRLLWKEDHFMVTKIYHIYVRVGEFNHNGIKLKRNLWSKEI